MKFKALFGGAAVSAVTLATLTIAPVSAVTQPPTPDTSMTTNDSFSQGTLTFYDSQGNVIHGGNDLQHLADYVSVSTPGRTGATKAKLSFTTPDHSKVPPNYHTDAWTSTDSSASTNFPVSSPSALSSITNPVVTLGGSDANLKSVVDVATLDHTAGFDNLMLVRVKDSGAGLPVPSSYWSAVVEFNNTGSAFSDGLAAGAWRQIWPTYVATTATSVSTPSATPSTNGQAAHGAPITLSVSVTAGGSAAPDGVVNFTDESLASSDPGYDLGNATNLGSGSYELNIGAPSDGVHTYAAHYVSNTSGYDPSFNDPSGATPPLDLRIVPAPLVILNPSISGSAKVGSSLTCNPGTWNVSDFTYSWFTGTSAGTATTPLASGTSSGALPASAVGKVVVCRVTGSNLSGSLPVTTSGVTVGKGDAPSVSVKPKINGVDKVGKVLTATSGTWRPTAGYTYTYTWKRYKAGKAGATIVVKSVKGHANQYKAVAADHLHYLVVVVTATRAGYNVGTSTSLPVKVA